jgi:voltage-gated potassium channel
MIFAVVSGLMLYVASVGIYIFEHDAQPDVFTSIPVSLWWAVASFTTVGYGDMVPITLGGRIFTTLVLFTGLGIIAVPSAIVTTALLEAEKELHTGDRKPD